ncbi:DUF523 domain-containing protein [Candidatus Bathyarchaeota archaeon]|nr:DUF523 domain-containing protein [Candidatus Bathyarchaeota archaeon]
MSERSLENKEPRSIMVLVVAHCVLNRTTRWWQKGQDVERNMGPVCEILRFLSKNKIGVFQLPCPEYMFLGNPRPPATKDDYKNLQGFKEHCEQLAVDSAKHLRLLVKKGREPKTVLLAIVGIERSPCCGVSCTPRKFDGETKYKNEKGLFFEALFEELKKLGCTIPMIGLDMHQPDDVCRKLAVLLKSRVE